MRRTYRWDADKGCMVEVVRSKHRGVRVPAYLGDRTLVKKMAAQGQVPVDELPRIQADCEAERQRVAKREKVRRAHQIADVVNQKGYRFT